MTADNPNQKSVLPSSASAKLDAELIPFAIKKASVGYWAWDIPTGYIYLSDTVLEMLQLSGMFNGEISTVKKLIHPDDYERVKTALKSNMTNKSFSELEFRLRRKDTSYIWLNIDGQTENDSSGLPHRVGGSVVDATAYVAMKQKLKQEERNLRLIFENVPARIWLKDSHNTIIRLNKKAADSMNMKVEDVEGASTYDLFPEVAKKYHEDDLVVINSGQPLLGIVERYAPKDGPHGWVSTDKLPFTDPETQEKYVLVLATDITQQKEYETEILENSIRLKQANNDLDHFAYMASHDLKAPLRGMDELAKWIEEDLGLNATPDIQRKIDLLRGRVARMDSLLKDILAFSRAGKNLATAEVIDIKDAVNEVIGWLPPLGEFEVHIDTDLPRLNVPRSAIEHIFLNLISNAIKHHDRTQGTINIGCKESEEYHQFYVTDDGPGIPKLYQDRVFEIFKQLKPRDDVEGSGIGLSIVKKMVEALGGKISISSSEGQRGTTFDIFLPKENS